MARPRLINPNYKLRANRSGYLEVTWTDPETGRSRYVSTGHKDRHTAELAAPGVIAKATAPKVATTVSEVCAAYLKGRTGKVHAIEAMEFAVRPVIAALGNMSPFDLTPAVVEDYVAKRRVMTTKHGQHFADGTILKECNALRSALRWAYKNRMLSRQPHPLAIPPFDIEPRDRYLTKDEVRRICQFAPPHVELFIRIATATAARRTAILELTWDKVELPDLELKNYWPEIADRLKLPAEHPLRHNPEMIFEGHGRDFEGADRLTKPVVFDMGASRGNKRRARTPVGNNMPLFFALVQAKKVALTPFVIEWKGRPVKTLKKSLETAFRKAAIEAPGHHVFKHTAVSWLVQDRVDWNVISSLSNTSVETLKRVYGRLSPDNFMAVGSAVTF